MSCGDTHHVNVRRTGGSPSRSRSARSGRPSRNQPTTSMPRQNSAPTGRGAQRGSVSPPGMTGGAVLLRIIHGWRITDAIGRPSFSCTTRAETMPGDATSTLGPSAASSASNSYCRSRYAVPQRAPTIGPFSGCQKSGSPKHASFSSRVTSGRNASPFASASGR